MIRSMTLLLIGIPAMALAADGVHEINQVTVLASGGYPYTIGAPGSYRLTGNLVVPLDTSGIVIASDDVHLDLAGFHVTGAPGSTSGNGIDGAGFSNHVVRDGSVERFGGTGVRTGTRSLVEGIVARENGADGIATGNRSRVVDSVAESNGEDGIDASSQNIVRRCTSRLNGGDAIEIAVASVVSDNSINGFGSGSGINGSGNSAIVARGNNLTLGALALGGNCLAVNNRIRLAQGVSDTGLSLGGGCGRAYNLIYAPDGTTVTGGTDVSTHAASNLCNGDAICP